MGLNLPLAGVAVYAVALVALYLAGKLLALPLKWTLRLIGNALLGAVALVLINVIGGPLGLHIGVNPLTAGIVGVLGVPGVLLLVILRFVL